VKFLCSIILIVSLVHSLQGQELYGKYLGLEQGLLSEECYDINFDKKGYLIVGTEYGPMKFNGEKFIPICTNLSMERRVMYDFEKDPQGNVYLVNSKSELFKLQDDKAVWIGPKNKIKLSGFYLNFLKLYYTNNHLYIVTKANFLKYSFETQKVREYYKTKFFDAKFVYNSKKHFPIRKYVGNGAFASNLKIEFPESNQHFGKSSNMNWMSREDCIQVGKSTYVLLCMNLFKKTDNQVSQLKFRNILFIEHFHNRIWLCTLDGLLELDSEGNLIHHHFKGEVIGGVAPLKSGGIAVSMNQKGVFISSRINDRVHYNFRPTAAASIHGTNLLGNMEGEVFKYTNYKLEKLVSKSPIHLPWRRAYHDKIVSISQYKGFILITSTLGTSLFSTNFKKLKDFRDPSFSIYSQFTNTENICFLESISLSKINWENLNTTPYPFRLKRFNLSDPKCCALLNDSIAIIGTNTGLVTYNLKTDRLSDPGIFKKEYRITGIQLIGKDKLLICTRFDGVYITYKNKIVRKIPIPCTSISSVLIYKNQIIIQGNNGIYIRSLNLATNSIWLKLFSGETQDIFILDHKILISYKNDLIIKNLSNSKSILKPDIVLNKFQLGNVGLPAFPNSIPANKSISVDIDVLQFDANKLGLYYILKGNNTISQQVEGTKINFDALKSGEYELKIHPVIDGKIQFNNSRTFRFTIEETFWESSVFYIISGVLIISLIFSTFLFVNLRRKRRSAERSELESKLNEYKLLAVKAQVNPHFLSNGLAAIQALILKGDNDLAAQYLAKFSFLMRKILYYSETQFISLNQELQLVDAYLELELLRFRNRFVIQKEIHLSESQLNEFQFPSLLLQPILENAIWHGLKFQENNPKLKISFEVNENQELFVQISDNGPGFNNSGKSEEHLSKGNQLITDRIDALNEQFQKTVASIKISSSNSGTVVAFTFSQQLYQSKQS
jgi:hypothetical protein